MYTVYYTVYSVDMCLNWLSTEMIEPNRNTIEFGISYLYTYVSTSVKHRSKNKKQHALPLADMRSIQRTKTYIKLMLCVVLSLSSCVHSFSSLSCSICGWFDFWSFPLFVSLQRILTYWIHILLLLSLVISSRTFNCLR